MIFFLPRFLGLQVQHMHVPRLGGPSELQLQVYVTVTAIEDPCPSGTSSILVGLVTGAAVGTSVVRPIYMKLRHMIHGWHDVSFQIFAWHPFLWLSGTPTIA